MVIALVGIVIGILIVIALIIKVSKTHPQEVAGIVMHCKKCGQETRGLKCSKCEPQRFGV
jgi:uncharacterized membrane protein